MITMTSSQPGSPAGFTSAIPRLALFVSLTVSAAAVRAQPPAPVFVAPIVEREIAPQQKFVGTVMPLRKSQVGSAASGRVEHLFVNEGDRVRQGQPLAVLRT